MFFNFDLCIIAFLKAFDIKGLLLKRIIFFFIGACLLRSADADMWVDPSDVIEFFFEMPF